MEIFFKNSRKLFFTLIFISLITLFFYFYKKDRISNKNQYYDMYTFHYWLWKNYLNNFENQKWICFSTYRRFWKKNNSSNQKELKNKIIYRASYRGTKEMDILMIGFVKSIIDKLDVDHLEALNKFINMDDEVLISIKKESQINLKNKFIAKIVDEFQKF